LGEKAGVKSKGKHHHVHGEEYRDEQTDEFCSSLPDINIVSRHVSLVSKAVNGIDNLVRGGENRIVITSNPVGGEVAECRYNPGTPFECLFDNPGTGRTPHKGYVKGQAQGGLSGSGLLVISLLNKTRLWKNGGRALMSSLSQLSFRPGNDANFLALFEKLCFSE